MNPVWFVFFFIAIAGILAVYFLSSKKGRPPSGLKNDPSVYDDLLRWTRGDRELAERLIAMEGKRHPNSDRVTLIRYAVERFRRDNK